MTIYQGLESSWMLWFAREHHWGMGLGLGPFEDKQAGHVQSMRAKGKTAEKQLKLELGKAWLSLFGNPLCQICRTALTLGWSNFMWWQSSECPQDLARANWNAAFISLRELQILWLGWSQIAESTDTWLWQSAPCLVAYPIVSVATKELSESVLLAVSIAPEKIFLSQRHCVQIWNCSRFQSSLATCHPVQRRVADCPTVWVCKCLRLIYLSALHLTLFNIYITNKTNSFNQMSLSWRYDYLPGAWISVDPMICKRASPVMGFGFGSVPGQTGWQYSKHESQRQNCWEAVEIETW